MNVLILHPGAMGASIGAALKANGHGVAWVPDGRSEATRKRAEDAGLRAEESIEDGLNRADVVICVCPPDAAMDVASDAYGIGFQGTYVDGNAVAPATAEDIGGMFGARFVDGGIIGPPAWRKGAMRFYLSGERAGEVAPLFEGSLVDARTLPYGAGSASALKMCYAAYTKGSSALLLAVRALAQSNGVGDALLAEWAISQPGLEARSAATAKSASGKAWRFAGEMREIAATFREADLPDGFHQAAAELYSRMAPLKDVEGGADIATVLETIAAASGRYDRPPSGSCGCPYRDG